MNTALSSYLDALRWRYATKIFDPSIKLPQSTVDGLVEAMRLTASSMGMQAWKIISVEDPAIRQQLLAVSNGQRQVVDASHLFVLCRPKHTTLDLATRHLENTAKVRGIPLESLGGFKQFMEGFLTNPPVDLQPWLDAQLYIMMGNLLSACAVAEVDACPMEGFSKKGYDSVLGLEKLDLQSTLVIPVGIRSQDDKYAKLAKVRYPVSEIFLTL